MQLSIIFFFVFHASFVAISMLSKYVCNNVILKLVEGPSGKENTDICFVAFEVSGDYKWLIMGCGV